MQTDIKDTGKARRTVGTILILLTGLLLVASAGVKFAHVPSVAAQMSGWGFDRGKLTLVAALEIISGLLFLITPTRSAGLLVASAYMGGAVATHVQHGEPFLVPAVFLTLIWLSAYLRHPQVLWSLGANSRSAGLRAASATRGGPLQEV
ncbi:MAG TPA: DoxX family protein [Pyrinomonadaceae bacterium]|jgi:hypothetical protein|nr:DoxX family protein [Pyrinomonadaceae bacterium]